MHFVLSLKPNMFYFLWVREENWILLKYSDFCLVFKYLLQLRSVISKVLFGLLNFAIPTIINLSTIQNGLKNKNDSQLPKISFAVQNCFYFRWGLPPSLQKGSLVAYFSRQERGTIEKRCFHQFST